MDEQSERIAQARSLENGKGVQYLIDEAYRILGNPCVLFNMEYELLFCAKNVVTDDFLWNEITGKGFFCDETIRFFLEVCFIDDVANSKTVALLTSDKLAYERLYGRVLNCYHNTVADLIAVACDRRFVDIDTQIFKIICEKLSCEIAKDEFFTRYGILYHEKLIRMLLDNDINDKVIYTGHLSNLYEDLKANIYVLVADAGASNLRELRDLCKKMQPELKYAVYADSIVIIASSDEAAPNAERDLHKLNAYFRSHSIRTGISGCFDNLFDLRRYYNEAVDSLKKTYAVDIR